MCKANKNVNDSNIILPKVKIYLYGDKLVEDWRRASPVKSHWRFYWNPEPGAEVSDKNKLYRLDKNFILAIPPGVRVKQVIVKPCQSLYIHAGFDLTVNDTADHIKTIPISAGLEESIRRLRKTFDQFVIGEFIFSIISRLPRDIWHRQLEDPRIEKVCRLLKKQPEYGWKNKDLAVKACFSENAFIRRFREVTGVPPQLFLRKLRLERAASLLLKNELSIEEIAASCGFCDRYYLTKMFKKHFGQSPGRYRGCVNIP